MTSSVQAPKSLAGALFIPVAKLWFIVAAFALNFLLPNLLTADQVGDFGVVNRFVSILNMVMITAVLQTVSKFVSEDESRTAPVQHAALRAQFLFAGTVSLCYFLVAPIIAGLFNDPALTPLFRASAPIPLLYGIYSVFIGCLNGTRSFRTQALFDIGYSTTRVLAILSAVVLGFGVLGTFLAFSTTAFAVTAIAAVVVARPRPVSLYTLRPMVNFALPLMGVVLFSNALLSADLFWVKALVDPSESKAVSGCYFGLLNLAVVPYMLVVSVSFILFPFVSHATFTQDHERTRLYIERSLRVTLLLAFAGGTVTATAPAALIALVYPSKPEWMSQTSSLQVLAVAYTILCIVSVMSTIVTASGRPLRALAAMGIAVGVQAIGVAFLIPRFGLPGAAAGSLLGFGAAAIFLTMHLRRRHGADVPLATVIRATAAAAAGVLGAAFGTPGGNESLLPAIVAGTVYLAALVMTREVTATDIARIREMT